MAQTVPFFCFLLIPQLTATSVFQGSFAVCFTHSLKCEPRGVAKPFTGLFVLTFVYDKVTQVATMLVDWNKETHQPQFVEEMLKGLNQNSWNRKEGTNSRDILKEQNGQEFVNVHLRRKQTKFRFLIEAICYVYFLTVLATVEKNFNTHIKEERT